LKVWCQKWNGRDWKTSLILWSKAVSDSKTIVLRIVQDLEAKQMATYQIDEYQIDKEFALALCCAVLGREERRYCIEAQHQKIAETKRG
jgi:hypothetical protein